MQTSESALSAPQSLNSPDMRSAPTGSKNMPAKLSSEAWLAFDIKTEQDVTVEQPQTVQRPLLGTFETLVLAGLIATVLVRHLVRGRRAVQHKV